ncbi:MAG: tetratricopeptide repeat protein, partial [Nitrospinae bacterium]|nr:tetratricopeptide repeat protein [Nitrospinota bacterium]
MEWLKQVEGRFVLYRGLPDASWEVKSSAYLRIEASQGEVPPSVFQNYIKWLLNRTGLQGFKKRGGEELSDLELLAELQHNGAATCLIDFTENALVALWFACREKPDKAGKVVAMATDEDEDFLIITDENLQDSIANFLNQDKLWKWEPRALNNRIVAQGSYFVFGEGKIEKERWHYEEIRVDAKSKGEIRKELKEKFGITEEHLFRDFAGFALSNAHDRPYSDYKAEDYFSFGLAFHQRRDFEKAINAYDKVIELAPEDMRAYRSRGIAKRASGDISGAIADFDKVIELAPEDMRAYRSRGI